MGFCDSLLYCPPTLPLGQVLPDFLRLAVWPSAVLPSITLLLGLFWCDGRRYLVRPLTVLPLPYSVPRLNAACFIAMGVRFLCNPLLCYPPYTASRLVAACFGAMAVGFLDDAFLCPPPCLGQFCLFWCGLCRGADVLSCPPPPPHCG